MAQPVTVRPGELDLSWAQFPLTTAVSPATMRHKPLLGTQLSFNPEPTKEADIELGEAKRWQAALPSPPPSSSSLFSLSLFLPILFSPSSSLPLPSPFSFPSLFLLPFLPFYLLFLTPTAPFSPPPLSGCTYFLLSSCFTRAPN